MSFPQKKMVVGVVRVGLYARVSLDDSHVGHRFQDPMIQVDAIKKFCEARGYVVVGEYVDRVSGASSNRPEFKRLMEDAYGGVFDVVVVWKLDRFSRERISVVMGYIDRLKGWGVGLVSVTESWLDTRVDNPVSELILSVMSWFAAEERRKISERTKAGIEKKKARGTYRGGRPVGSKDKKPRRKGGYYKRK